MASIDLEYVPATAARNTIPHRIRAMLRLWRLTLRRARHRREMVNELRDPRLLADIGVPPARDRAVPLPLPPLLGGD